MGVRRNFSRIGQRKILLILFRFLTMQMHVDKTLYPFCPKNALLFILVYYCNLPFILLTKRFTIYFVLLEPQFSIFSLKCCFLHFGCQKCFFFHKLPNIHFSSAFYK